MLAGNHEVETLKYRRATQLSPLTKDLNKAAGATLTELERLVASKKRAEEARQ